MKDYEIYNILEKNGFVFIRPFVQHSKELKVLAYVGGGSHWENMGCTLLEGDSVEIGTAWNTERLEQLLIEIKRDREINNLLEE